MSYRFSSNDSVKNQGRVSLSSNEGLKLSTGSVLDSCSFPDVSSSQEKSFSKSESKDSFDLEVIKQKNIQMFQAFKSSVKRFKAKSEEMFESATEEKPEKQEETFGRFCVSAQPRDEGPSEDLSKLQMFLEKVREINSTRLKTQELINKEKRIIEQVSVENKELRERLEQVAFELCNESLDGEEKCKCLIF